MSAVLPDDAVEQFFEVFVVAFEAPKQDLMVVRQGEKRPRYPAGGDGHAQLTPAIVVENVGPFKAQLFNERLNVALDVQAEPVLTPGAARRRLRGSRRDRHRE